METTRKPYPSDVSDAEWAFVVPYLALLPEDAEQRKHDLREVFNALRWLLRTGAPWRLLARKLTGTDGPGMGRGAKVPPARYWYTYRWTVARPTPNVVATTVWGVPFSTARTTRSRRTTEYAFISPVYRTHRYLRKSL
jgi:hypothetical protein